MAITLHKLCIVFISIFLLFCPSLSHQSIPNRCLSHESEALLRFKAAFNNSKDLRSWVNGTDCCTSWIGIYCDDYTNHVVSVYANGYPYLFEGVISESLCQLHFLTSLEIIGILTSGITIPTCLGNLSYIETLDFSGNSFSGMIPRFLCLLTRLKKLVLSENNFNGSIPSCFGNLASLTYLSLGNNQLSGNIPAFLGNLSLLRVLALDGNQLDGIIPDSLANLSLLNSFSINNNQLIGTIPPSFAQLSSLNYLSGLGNHFNETISSSSLPPSLTGLYLSLNHHQLISETFFHNLTSLHYLGLSDCVLNVSTTWIPPFQLYHLSLVSCMIDSEFPPWISTQISLEYLEITNANLVGVIPSWLWETNPLMSYLNLSGNHLEGSLFSNTLTRVLLEELDVSRNGLSGHIPSMWPSNISVLLLNDNLFTGNIPTHLGKLSQLSVLSLANNSLNGNIPSSLGKLSQLQLLNLANNNITGVIPVSLTNCSFHVVLNLGNNSLEGSLPHELNKLSQLYSLVVHSNNLNGSFPPSIENCSQLQVLDIGNNLFGGEIPTLIGNISELRVLVLKENNFTGNIPLEIGQLMNLQILLLSSNHISGSIPHTIVLLQAMAIEGQDGFILSPAGVLYHDGLDMTLKGVDQHYPYILSTLTSIDLSNNELEGEVPSNFGNLKGLRLLNLSMNNLNGTIPNSLGDMHQLDSLDLSKNHFSGQVPPELESLSYLGSLNLSNNNLSGSIPQGRHMTSTFGESSYLGNPNLWGCPLPKKCSWPQYVPPPPLVSINKRKKSNKYPWYEIALGLSYGIAFGGIISLILIKMSWRRKYFNKIDTILKFLFPWMKNLTL